MEFTPSFHLTSITFNLTMKTLFISAILTITTMSLFGQSDSFKLPNEWDKDFIISASHTGSMSSSNTYITFTYDSCTYKTTSRNAAPKEKKFGLSEIDRSTILKKMREMKVENIKQIESSVVVQRDGWSNSICFGLHCIEGGSAANLSDEDKNNFLDAYRFLEDFVINRKKGKKL